MAGRRRGPRSRGFLAPGATLWARSKAVAGRTAEVGEDGQIWVDGVVFATPSAAAKAVTGAQSEAGWWFWLVDPSAKSSLDTFAAPTLKPWMRPKPTCWQLEMTMTDGRTGDYMTPAELARKPGVSPRAIRLFLRERHGRLSERGQMRWTIDQIEPTKCDGSSPESDSNRAPIKAAPRCREWRRSCGHLGVLKVRPRLAQSGDRRKVVREHSGVADLSASRRMWRLDGSSQVTMSPAANRAPPAAPSEH